MSCVRGRVVFDSIPLVLVSYHFASVFSPVRFLILFILYYFHRHPLSILAGVLHKPSSGSSVLFSATYLFYSLFSPSIYYQLVRHNGPDQWRTGALERFACFSQPSITDPGLVVCPVKLTMPTETPEQLTNGNHPEETQEEDNTGGTSPVAYDSILRTCY